MVIIIMILVYIIIIIYHTSTLNSVGVLECCTKYGHYVHRSHEVVVNSLGHSSLPGSRTPLPLPLLLLPDPTVGCMEGRREGERYNDSGRNPKNYQ